VVVTWSCSTLGSYWLLQDLFQGKIGKWSNPLASGASPLVRGFESHSCHCFCCPLYCAPGVTTSTASPQSILHVPNRLQWSAGAKGSRMCVSKMIAVEWKGVEHEDKRKGKRKNAGKNKFRTGLEPATSGIGNRRSTIDLTKQPQHYKALPLVNTPH
jgi:hypothetical protein